MTYTNRNARDFYCAATGCGKACAERLGWSDWRVFGGPPRQRHIASAEPVTPGIPQ